MFRRKRKPKNIYQYQFNDIIVTAPFANAVLNGKNVAANPPQTSLWYLLYAQVKQADGITNRNILLLSEQLRYRPLKNKNNTVEEGTKYGSAVFHQENVIEKLKSIGLPASTSLSVICVEMFPLKNIWRMQHRDSQTGTFFNNDNISSNTVANEEGPNPLIEGLGRYRIYRTSPLVAVGDICCVDC